MRDFLMFMMFVFICIIGVSLSITSMRLKNVERKTCKIENAYAIIIEENEQLKRINDQNLRLLAEGGWDE